MPWPLCYDPGGYGWNRTTMTEGRPVDVALLRRFSPLDGMKNENLMALARKVAVAPLAANASAISSKSCDPDWWIHRT